jgi:hypothetical protein
MRTPRDVAISRQKINANRIISKLEKKLKRGNYENFGMKELRSYKELLQAEDDLTYQDRCDLADSLSERIEEIQHQ